MGEDRTRQGASLRWEGWLVRTNQALADGFEKPSRISRFPCGKDGTTITSFGMRLIWSGFRHTS